MISSWGYIECEFPKGTETHGDGYYISELGNGHMYLSDDICNQYSNHVLDDLVEFFGRPLDEVDGLELHVEYETADEGYFRMEFDIVNGKKTYKESRVVMDDAPLYKCPFDYGQRNK